MWGREKALEMLGLAGFAEVDVHELEHDIQNYFYVTRKPLDAPAASDSSPAIAPDSVACN
jgi:hypothetical protein